MLAIGDFLYIMTNVDHIVVYSLTHFVTILSDL